MPGLGFETIGVGCSRINRERETHSIQCTLLLRNTNPPKPETRTVLLWCFMSLIRGFSDREKSNPTSESSCLFTVYYVIKYCHYSNDK